MLTYSELSKGEKKCIDAFISHRPELANVSELATKEVYAIWDEIYNLRSSGAPKVAYPNWLTKHNSIRRGLISFPGPNSKQSTLSNADKPKIKKVDKVVEDIVIDEDEFFDELREFGIEV